jgi:hypothetical protein
MIKLESNSSCNKRTGVSYNFSQLRILRQTRTLEVEPSENVNYSSCVSQMARSLVPLSSETTTQGTSITDDYVLVL